MLDHMPRKQYAAQNVNRYTLQTPAAGKITSQGKTRETGGRVWHMQVYLRTFFDPRRVDRKAMKKKTMRLKRRRYCNDLSLYVPQHAEKGFI